MSIPSLISRWRADPSIADNVDSWYTIPARPPQWAGFPDSLHPALRQALQSAGVRRLYSHQAQSYEAASAGQNLVVVTGTASGKTLCYNLPVLDRLVKQPQGRALYLFPTKALSQDQANGLRSLIHQVQIADQESPTTPARPLPGLPLAVYDGDTPSGHRAAIRKTARLVISNPDMLHTGVLPHHTIWADFFRSLQFVVIDEIHAYRGVFGSHVANVLRRLRRICRAYGAHPQFILTSATIANPAELAEELIEDRVVLIDQDGAGRGPKHFLIYNPPVVNPDLGLRRSALQESVRLAGDLLTYQVQTIIFGRSRRSVEIILTYLRQSSAAGLAAAGRALSTRPGFPDAGELVPQSSENGLPETIRGYRSGYLPGKRREIEQGLREGQVQAVVATNALELGVDIGGMGAALLVGYPGSIAATWQQAGRAGRGAEAALAVLVATADPLDQFLAGHPDYIFERPPEQALINPDNLLILLDHLRCAAFELPFQENEPFGKVQADQVKEFLDFLQEQGVLHRSGPKYFWMADQYPAQAISLRSASVDNVLLQTTVDEQPVTLGEIDYGSAHWMVHPQAIYMHEGQSYFVEELDLEQKVARLKRMESDFYTIPRSETTIQLLEKQVEEPSQGSRKSYGEISVTTQVVGYRKVKWYTHENLGLGDLILPPSELQTTGYWISLNEETVSRLRDMGLWNNDPNDYGPEWPDLRDRVRARDGCRCQVCGAPEQGRSHDVHHRVPFRTFASPQQANQLSNLVTLCRECHRRAETAVRVRSGLAGLGFVLGHLAPLFLMCDVRDLGVHTDPQSPLGEGEPVVVIYDQIPAGIGLSQRLFEIHAELLNSAYELVASCPCTGGCPSCTGPGGENGAGGKQETLAILQALTGYLL